MAKLVGERLKEKYKLSDKQLQAALEHQRLHGGRLGNNLVELGFISEEELDSFFHIKPLKPGTLEETGLNEPFVTDLVMKHLLYLREFSLPDLVERIKLPVSILQPIIEKLRRKHLIEARGAGGLTTLSMRYSLTEPGKRNGQELLALSRYVGPAPVMLSDYRRMTEMQTVENIVVDEQQVKQAFSELVIDDSLLLRIGTAVSSGRAIFLYGPAGNGKTAIAETVTKLLPDTVFVPYAIMVDDDVIALYDPVNHVAVEGDEENIDKRWIKVKRPVVMSGGELSLDMLDLDFNPVSKYYEAPLQLKANNGIFIVDDFGRQQIDPQQLLNRWIVPLERRIDFLALQSGMKFEIPFDQLIIFSTNIKPSKLVDEAFLRRIRYKILIDHPSREQYVQVFRRVCEMNRVEFRPELLDYLFNHFYERLGVKLNACHPRDLIDHIIDDAHYRNQKPILSEENLTAAWSNYFVIM